MGEIKKISFKFPKVKLICQFLLVPCRIVQCSSLYSRILAFLYEVTASFLANA